MYHKVKNTLAGLGMVLAFLVGGIALSEPVPTPPIPAQAQVGGDHALARAVVRTVLTLAAHEQARAAALDVATQAHDAAAAAQREARAKAASRLRLQLGMPYYSFGEMLPRRRES